MNCLKEKTVGQLVVEKPARARVFEKLGIDYCCGGKKPLATACDEKNLSLDAVLAELEAVAAASADAGQNLDAKSLTELADHIETTHHAYLKTELPRLDMLTAKVARAHGPNDARLLELRDTFVAFRAELESHMAKEEQILFPLCRQLEQSAAPSEFHCGSVANPIRVMVMEHDHAGEALSQFRGLTDGYVAPAHACNTYRALLDALDVLERDMHQHVHTENNILFPRAIDAEAAVRAQ